MKNLIFNFMQRWWWMYLLIALVTGASAYLRHPAFVAPFALICMQFDVQRGFFRAVRPLPLSNKEQSNAFWIIGVPLAPLLSIIPFTIGGLVSQPAGFMHAGVNLPFACAVQVWISLGYSAIGFLLIMFLLNRRPVDLRETVQQVFIGGLWGLSFMGNQLLTLALPKAPSEILAWHWALFLAVPIFVLGSYLAAPNIVNRKVSRVSGSSEIPQNKNAEKAGLNGLVGLPLFLATVIGRLLFMMLLITLLQHGIRYLESGGLGSASSSSSGDSMMPLTMAIMICVTSAEFVNLRSLRILPLGTRKLANLLALIPAAIGISSAFFINHSPALLALPNATALEMGGIVTGLGTFLFALNLQASGGWRIAVVMLAATIGPAMLSAKSIPHILLAVALGLGFIAYCGLYFGLRRSHSFYKSRQMFGIDPNNPMSA